MKEDTIYYYTMKRSQVKFFGRTNLGNKLFDVGSSLGGSDSVGTVIYILYMYLYIVKTVVLDP